MKFLIILFITISAINFVKCENEEEPIKPPDFALPPSAVPPIALPPPPVISEPKKHTQKFDPKNCSIDPPPTLEEIMKIYNWMDAHNKTYKNAEQKVCKMVRIVYNMREIEAHNQRFEKGEVKFKRAPWSGTDLSHDEKDQRYAMKDIQHVDVRAAPPKLPNLPPARNEVDYVAEGLVSPAIDQRKCGSCYAWAAIGALEAQVRKCNITQEPLSVQSIVDCATTGCWGCQSGWPYWSYKWMMMSGILIANKYPYKASAGQCAYNKTDIIATVSSAVKYDFTSVNGNASFIKQLVSSVGPVAAVICTDPDLYSYSEGVFVLEECCTAITHAVTIVGYGTDPDFGDYWLIKNSWGPGWGINGFAKFGRGTNLCMIESQVAYATVKKADGKACP